MIVVTAMTVSLVGKEQRWRRLDLTCFERLNAVGRGRPIVLPEDYYSDCSTIERRGRLLAPQRLLLVAGTGVTESALEQLLEPQSLGSFNSLVASDVSAPSAAARMTLYRMPRSHFGIKLTAYDFSGAASAFRGSVASVVDSELAMLFSPANWPIGLEPSPPMAFAVMVQADAQPVAYQCYLPNDASGDRRNLHRCMTLAVSGLALHDLRIPSQFSFNSESGDPALLFQWPWDHFLRRPEVERMGAGK